MEIKGNQIRLTLSEAVWVVRRSGVDDNFRRAVECARRAVLPPLLPDVDFTDVALLAKDTKTVNQSRALFAADVAMQRAEARYPKATDGSEQHVVAVEGGERLLDDLYVGAEVAYVTARAETMDFRAHMDELDEPDPILEAYCLGELSPAEQEIFEEQAFGTALHELQVTSGIMTAINDFRQQ